jgi:hypothetical protein
MTDPIDWEIAFENELRLGERARLNGNEGRARVCARRAAGIVISEYFKRKGNRLSSTSAYDLLNIALQEPDLPPQAAEICQHLSLRLAPDFSLPIPADLLSEARMLKSVLLQEAV